MAVVVEKRKIGTGGMSRISRTPRRSHGRGGGEAVGASGVRWGAAREERHGRRESKRWMEGNVVNCIE
ncbi:hypothetical protein CRG98_032323 [Punica granatum]|uniref:Uncharacterized protein n=1 Tax=Punica granatum TaxID=22663 RepID=A0A2I0IUF4_PUNGR|nr:hypothetical protein CRG98_032323 [Punica granatum]